MKRKDLDEVELKFAMLRDNAEELSALVYETYPDHAEKLRKIANYAASVRTCVRLNGALPATRPAPKLVEAAKNVQKIGNALGRLRKVVEDE